MRRLGIVAVGVALVTTFFVWSTSSVPFGPTWAQGPTPLPGGGLDKTLAYDVHVANHQWGHLGVFDQFQCQWATVYIQATLNESDTDGTFDLVACMSDSPDPYDPSVCSSLGNTLVMGYPAGTWKTFYPLTPLAGPLFCSPGGPARQYVHFRVFSNQAGRYVAEVHCRPTYPSELPTPTATSTPAPDADGDGCGAAQEATMGFDDAKWYDFYDVSVPAVPDMTSNGPRNQVVDMGDVLGVLFYVFADDNGPPNGNGVDYDSVKGSCDWNADTTPDEEGLCYDRSPGPEPNPPWDAGPPNGVIDMGDVLAALGQFGLDCSGPP